MWSSSLDNSLDDEPLDRTPLAIADTVPAEKWGITYDGAVWTVLGFTWVMTQANTKLTFFGGLALVLATFIAMQAMLKSDHNLPRIIGLWFQTKALCFDTHVWGGVSVDPDKWPAERRWFWQFWRPPPWPKRWERSAA